MRATFWTLAAIIAATTGLSNAVSISDHDASTAIDSTDLNFAETDVYTPPADGTKKTPTPKKVQKKAGAPAKAPA